MPLHILLRGLWRLKFRLAALALLLMLAGAALILSWPRAYLAGAVIAPAETTLEDVFIEFMAGSKDNMA